MTSKEVLLVLDDLHKELEANSLEISTIILVSDHTTGESFSYNSGFIDVQAILLKLLFEKDPVLKATFIHTMLHKELES